MVYHEFNASVATFQPIYIDLVNNISRLPSVFVMIVNHNLYLFKHMHLGITFDRKKTIIFGSSYFIIFASATNLHEDMKSL